MSHHDRAAKLHTESIIIDSLNVSDWREPEVFTQLYQGGLTAVNATIALWENFPETLDNIARWYPRFEKYSDIIMSARTVADIERAKAEGKCGIIFGFQNSSPIEDDLRRLPILYELGVRIIQVTYNNSNLVGAGYGDSPDYGLSYFGVDFVAECNRIGILLDCSHVGHKTTMDTIEASTKPIAFTHAGPRVLCDFPRNKTDEALKALADKGGVVGANAWPPFLAQGSNATLSDYLDTVDYMVKLIGIDHVGIGPDFTHLRTLAFFRWIMTGRNIDKDPRLPVPWPVTYPKGFRTATEFPNVTRALLERGYSETDTKKIMGENFMRLFREVWK